MILQQHIPPPPKHISQLAFNSILSLQTTVFHKVLVRKYVISSKLHEVLSAMFHTKTNFRILIHTHQIILILVRLLCQKVGQTLFFCGVPGHTDLPRNLSFDVAAEESIVLRYLTSD